MRIYSMTATFGKLENQTLSFLPGLNVISAPNEWGKTTWCDFLIAMLYGIDSKERTKQGSIAHKERYAPWSGSPMSGRMDICWDGRDITIERYTKGRAVFGEFRAYETATGIPVTQLTAANCGQTLLGVEKSVFTRSAFIRLTDLPVTNDDSLRRRLNALVTTGDESGASDALAQKLKELKNRCRHHKTGLLPQAEAQQQALLDTLSRLQQLQQRAHSITKRQEALDEQIALLENHKAALAYAQAQADSRRVSQAQQSLSQAEETYRLRREQCERLPDRETAYEQILGLEQLQLQQEALLAETLPPPPQKIEPPAPFAGMTPEKALEKAEKDTAALEKLHKPADPLLLIFAAVCLVASVLLIFLTGYLSALSAVLLGGLFAMVYLRNNNRQKKQRLALLAEYAPLLPADWVGTAQAYRDGTATCLEQEAVYKAMAENLAVRRAQLAENIEYYTAGASLSECLDGWQETLAIHESLLQAEQAVYQAQLHAQTLAQMAKPATPPTREDLLTQSPEETEHLLAEALEESRQLQLQRGQVLGQMEALGQEETLRRQLEALRAKIEKLETVYTAATIALETLSEASSSLQRKFAPRISGQAQTLFTRLTGGRYDRFLLGEDMDITAAAQGEIPMRSSLWRSDGTADQQYLALRLAVAQELMPLAPLVLDDALVRFDDTRLALAMEILEEVSRHKQVILFSCQGREKEFL